MSIFDTKSTNKKILELEKAIDKSIKIDNRLKEEIDELKQTMLEISKRSPELEKEARQASKMTSEYKNKTNETLNLANEYLTSIIAHKEVSSNATDKISTLLSDSETQNLKIEEILQEVEDTRESFFEKITSTDSKIQEIQSVFDEHPNIEEDIESIEDFFLKTEEVYNKSNQLLKTIASRKNEIDRLYNEIIGFEEVNEDTGEKTYVNGIKHDLSDAYEGLNEKIDQVKESLESLETSSTTKYQTFFQESTESNSKLLSEWRDKHLDINEKIQGLLPNALTAGLSHAFSKKKEDEVDSYEKHKSSFNYGIIGMILVSLIPFILSIKFIIDQENLDIIIDRAPRIVLAILPLYLPVLWLSISSSKKINLSKRLIEEYSHKEVLSKTFEGLSSQIENLDKEDISNELRISLLQNFLQMYSENPGKLISHYNSSDHPVMEVLESTNKLENSIQRLSKIPGLEKITEILEKRHKEKSSKTSMKINDGLDIIDNETNMN